MKCPNTHAGGQAGQQAGRVDRSLDTVCVRPRERRAEKALRTRTDGRTRTDHRHCDANYSAHLSFFRFHRRRQRGEGRRGDGAIFSHLVKYLGGTSVECSSSAAAAAAASIWVGYMRAGRVRPIVLYSYHNTALSPTRML